MSLPRFHVPDARALSLVTLSPDATHHAARVLRLRHGAEVRVFDGEGREYAGRLDSVSRERVVVALGDEVEPRRESPLVLTLALAPLKGDRMDLVVQKATELGVHEIRPVLTARTDPEGRPSAAGARDIRWRRIASAAAEQCGRAVVPRVHGAVALDAFLADALPERRVLLLETPGHHALRETEAAAAIVALVGPPGGFTDAEIEAALASGFIARSLGPRVLRSETAAIAVVSMLQALFGDLG
jgi:16S rRNA (uracil1498-N3)-methyltransferase